MAKRGRPKKKESEVRTARLPAIRLTEGERVKLEQKAERAGVDLSEWVRRELTAAPIPRPKTPQLGTLLVELSRIGNNVNQIARQLNRGRDADPHHLNAVMGELHTTIQNVSRKYGS